MIKTLGLRGSAAVGGAYVNEGQGLPGSRVGLIQVRGGAYLGEDDEGLRVEHVDVAALCPDHQAAHPVFVSCALLQRGDAGDDGLKGKHKSLTFEALMTPGSKVRRHTCRRTGCCL